MLITNYPRFYVDATEIRSIYDTGRYKRLFLPGLDEDVTTIAVNTFHELNERNNVERLVVGCDSDKFNYSIFLEATGLEPDNVTHFNMKDTAGIYALHESVTRGIPFLVVGIADNPEANQMQCSAVGIAGKINGNSDLEVHAGLLLDKPRYAPQFTGSGDEELVEFSSKLEQPYHVNIINIALLRKSKNAVLRKQVESGYMGCATPLLELVSFDKTAVLVAGNSDEVVKLSISDLDVGEHSETICKKLSVSQLVARQSFDFSADPGRIPQGAYIPGPTYNAERAARYRLVSSRCKSCDQVYFPPRQLCRECRGRTEEGPQLSRYGKIYSITNILSGAAPTEFLLQQKLEGEYLVAIIELNTGNKVISQITDASIDEVEIGADVKYVFRKIYTQDNADRYGYKFVRAMQK